MYTHFILLFIILTYCYFLIVQWTRALCASDYNFSANTLRRLNFLKFIRKSQ